MPSEGLNCNCSQLGESLVVSANPTRPKNITPAPGRRRRRLFAILTGVTLLGTAVALVLSALEDSIIFFYSPSDLNENKIDPGELFRLGGLVVKGSVSKAEDGITTLFAITDLANTVNVSYEGQLPDLFREGQGVVTEGSLLTGGLFKASEVLAKHDENYMPAEVAEALKKTGQWREP